MPYRGFDIDISATKLAEIMSHDSSVGQIKRVGLPDGEWQHHANARCHMQGIAVTHQYLFTSCFTKEVVNPNKRTGYVQRYWMPEPAELYEYVQGKKLGGTVNKKLFGHPFPHSAIGHPALGIPVFNSLGVFTSDFMGRYAIPIVSTSSGTGDQTRIDLLDAQSMQLEFADLHTPHPGDDWHGLSCSSLIDLDFDGQRELCLLALSNKFIYLYRFRWSETGHAFFGMVRLAAQKPVLSSDGVDEKWPPQGKQHAYQSIVALHGTGGEIFVLAGHDEWIDTYVLKIDFDLNNPLRLTKIAKLKYGSHGTALKGLFFEGMDVQMLKPNEFRMWLAPFDYRRSRCLEPADNKKCTHLWYIDRSW